MTSFARRSGGFDPRWVTQLLQNYTMPYYILHIKEAKRLEATLSLVGFLEEHMAPRMRRRGPHMLRLAHETENMALNAEMILRASLFRTESRGSALPGGFPPHRRCKLAGLEPDLPGRPGQNDPWQGRGARPLAAGAAGGIPALAGLGTRGRGTVEEMRC